MDNIPRHNWLHGLEKDLTEEQIEKMVEIRRRIPLMVEAGRLGFEKRERGRLVKR